MKMKSCFIRTWRQITALDARVQTATICSWGRICLLHTSSHYLIHRPLETRKSSGQSNVEEQRWGLKLINFGTFLSVSIFVFKWRCRSHGILLATVNRGEWLWSPANIKEAKKDKIIMLEGPEREQSFVLRSCTIHELRNPNVSIG